MSVRIYLSRWPEKMGGGSNSFSLNFHKYAKRSGIRVVRKIDDADAAIIIAGRGISPAELQTARDRGCFVIHRIDEHFGAFTDPNRLKKHEKIADLNRLASITVFQSEFVRQNAQPYLGSERYCVIYNGGDPAKFRMGNFPGSEIGHITWSLLEKKGLKDLHQEIEKRPSEKFRLVGLHQKAISLGLDFNRPNALLRGERPHSKMPAEFRKMKILYFPSRDDPCPNTVVEAILSGVPVCYHDSGGTPELVRNCGEPLDQFDELLYDLEGYRENCLGRSDLHFDGVFKQYMDLIE